MMKEKKVNVAKLIYNGDLMGYRVSVGGRYLIFLMRITTSLSNLYHVV